MTGIKDDILKHAAALNAVVGDPIPALTDALREAADHAVDNEIFQMPDGSWFRVDFAAMDWSGADSPNKQLVSMGLLRFKFLPGLASAYRETGDERYATAARTSIEAFIRDHPTTDDWEPRLPYDTQTQYELRIGSRENPGWIGCLPTFLNSAAFDDDFVEAVVASARAHLRYLAKHIYPARNIRITHGDVLLTNSLRLGFLSEAPAWREQGLTIINQAIRWQIQQDGSHIEAVPGYHGVAMNMMDHFWRLNQGMPELGLKITTAALAGMYDYSLTSSCPNGHAAPLHDTGNNRASKKHPANQQIRNNRAAFRARAGLPDELPPEAVHLPDAGQIYMRDSWDERATYITLDGTKRGSFHWQPCRNSMILYANGGILLDDPGYSFKSHALPHHGAGTQQHNTLCLNGWDQSETAAILQHTRVDGYDVAEGEYGGGYWPLANYATGRGIPGFHHRTILWIHGRAIVVLDNLYCPVAAEDRPNIEVNWQLPEGQIECDLDERQVNTCDPASNLLMLFPVMPESATIEVHEGEHNPARGWLAGEWAKTWVPAPQVSVKCGDEGPWYDDFATVLIPYTGTETPCVKAAGCLPQSESVPLDERAGNLTLTWEDGSVDKLLWTRALKSPIGANSNIETDAALVHLSLDADGETKTALVHRGTFLQPSGGATSEHLDTFVLGMHGNPAV